MCYGKIVRNSHSRVEQFLLSSRVTTACLWLLHSAQYKPVALNLFTEGRRIQIYDFVRVALKNFNSSQFTCFVLLQTEVCYTKY